MSIINLFSLVVLSLIIYLKREKELVYTISSIVGTSSFYIIILIVFLIINTMFTPTIIT